MTLGPLDLILVGLILFVGSALQSAIGFAFGLFAINALLLIGFQPYEAIATVIPCVFIQSGWSLYRHREDAPWKAILPLAVLAVACQPIGVWLLGRLVEIGQDRIRQVFGFILLFALVAQAWLRPRPRDHVPVGWGLLAFAVSGVLTGLCGMGGPPLVLWVMAHDWSSARSRAALWIVFLLAVPTNLLLQGLRFGEPVWHATGIACLFFPIVILGVWPGLWLGRQFPKPVLQRIAFVLLALIAADAILRSVVVDMFT